MGCSYIYEYKTQMGIDANQVNEDMKHDLLKLIRPVDNLTDLNQHS